MLRIVKLKFFNQLIKNSKLIKCPYSSTVIECLKNKSIIAIGGPDAKDFLQGHLTNDINHFENQTCKSMYSMILNHQGRVLYDVIIYSIPGNYLIECEKSISDDLIKHLLRYKLRKKINIALDGGILVWVSYCKNLQLSKNNKLNVKESIISTDDPRLPDLCTRHLISSSVNDLKLSNCEHISGFYNQLRYKNGIGEGPNDLLNANCFPLESNLDFLNGVSFQKGCYVGQELTARTHHTGVIRKRLMPILIKQPLAVEAGANVETVDGKSVGKVRGFNGVFGLGLLRIAESMKSVNILVRSNGTTIEASTHIPDWWLTGSDEIVRQTLDAVKKN